MVDRKRIAFLRPNIWPLANTKVEAEIRKQFTDYDVEVINIKPAVAKYPRLMVVNIFYTLLFYGIDILLGKKNLKDAFWHTPYIFHAFKQMVAKQLSQARYSFTFQMQSLFDCSIPGVPHFVYTDHTHLANLKYPEFDPKKLFSPKWIDLEKQIYNNAVITFVRSSNIKQSLIEQYQYPPERVICVYAGSNVAVVDNETRQKDYTGKKILYVGIDWKRKGGPELVRAFQTILAQHPDATLTIVGADPKIDVPRCTVLGKIPPEKVTQHYEEATIFCLPTHLEPFGIAFLEAMQARLPIVGTRVGAIPDFVRDGWNGFLVAPGDVPGLAEALLKLLNSPEQRRDFGERGFTLAKEQYSWEAVGKRLHQHICDKLPQDDRPVA
jgi:glycosyltransferase involved in cell wall biosynthesis